MWLQAGKRQDTPDPIKWGKVVLFFRRSFKSITSSNDHNISEISSFRSASNITTESNTRINPNGSLIFVIDANDQK